MNSSQPFERDTDMAVMKSTFLTHGWRSLPGLKRLGLILVSASTVVLQVALVPAFAGDPFRTSGARTSISDDTEDAFYAIFRDGDYVTAADILQRAEADDPLHHAMLASLAYLEGNLPELLDRAELTQGAAEGLMSSDPLRGNLYGAVGIFLEGAHVLQYQGIARGTPRALGMLQQVFDKMDAAEAIDADDPELSLIKGFMDLLLAVNLPFANPEDAIARLGNYGRPEYIAQRGIAVGYRDLGEYSQALEAVEAAMEAVETATNGETTNPDLLQLKAQIFAGLGRNTDSAALYTEALGYANQLPPATVARLTFDRCIVQGNSGPSCAREAGYN
jgi:tetratricopeptide (TPR) repeat protein